MIAAMHDSTTEPTKTPTEQLLDAVEAYERAAKAGRATTAAAAADALFALKNELRASPEQPRVVILFASGDFVDAWAWPTLAEARAFAKGVTADLEPGQELGSAFVLPEDEATLAGAGLDEDELAEARRTAALRLAPPATSAPSRG